MATARQAIALQPDAVLPWRALCNSLPYRDGIGAAELLQALRRLRRAAAAPGTADVRQHADPRSPAGIGLLSGTLRTHPVGWLTIAGFETLDPAAFDIVCLAQRRPRPDRATRSPPSPRNGTRQTA